MGLLDLGPVLRAGDADPELGTFDVDGPGCTPDLSAAQFALHGLENIFIVTSYIVI
jgi:hypothetical protein